jgi:hypothetical protein
LDRHMMFPLLEYLDGLINAGTISYSSKDVAAARLALLRPTHMVDYAIDIYKSVHGESSEVPKEMEDQKSQVFKQLEELQSGCKVLADLCENQEEKVSDEVECTGMILIQLFIVSCSTSLLHMSSGKVCCQRQMECRCTRPRNRSGYHTRSMRALS